MVHGAARHAAHPAPRLSGEVDRQHIGLALAHGTNVFIVDWYWYESPPCFEPQLNEGLIPALKGTDCKLTDEKSKNLVWKTRLPVWSLADPVVVGDRVFAVGEPDRLTCADAHSDKVLWQTRVLPLLCDGKTLAEAARLQQVIDIAAVFSIFKGGHGSSLFA